MTESIRKMTPDATLGQITSSNQGAAQLLSAIGLDPVSQKEHTLKFACKQLKWSEVEVLQWLKDSCLYENEQNNNDSEANEFDGTATYWYEHSKEQMEIMEALLVKINDDFPRVHKIHGNQYPWLKNMAWPLEQFSKEFKNYSALVRNELSSLAKEFNGINGKEENVNNILTDDLKRSVNTMEIAQKKLQLLMDEIQAKGNSFNNPAAACSTHRILNQNFKLLFEKLSEQFSAERTEFLSDKNQTIQA